jgi:hypothetical protein
MIRLRVLLRQLNIPTNFEQEVAYDSLVPFPRFQVTAEPATFTEILMFIVYELSLFD